MCGRKGIKKQLEEEEERRANLMKWGIWFQGVEHWVREPVGEKGKQGLPSPPPRPTAPPAECALPQCSGNIPTFVVMDGSMEKEDGMVVRLNSETINCDYESTKEPRPSNRIQKSYQRSSARPTPQSEWPQEGSLRRSRWER